MRWKTLIAIARAIDRACIASPNQRECGDRMSYLAGIFSRWISSAAEPAVAEYPQARNDGKMRGSDFKVSGWGRYQWCHPVQAGKIGRFYGSL